MNREFTVIIERDEDGFFVGIVPQLKGCHSQASSLDELMERMKEAVLVCLEAEGEVGAERPRNNVARVQGASIWCR